MRRRHLLIGFVLGPVLIGILTVLLAGSELALQWAARRISETSGGKVTVSGVSGSLARTLRVERIRYRTEEREVTVENAEIVWSPMQLLHDRIAIDSLSMSTLTIETLKKSDKPPELPQKLALPLDLHIGEATIGTLAFVRGGSRTELGNLRVRLDAGERHWQLHELAFDTEFGAVTGAGEISTAKPYPVSGTLRLRGSDARADATFGGDLGALQVAADFNAYGGSGTAKAVASPFDAIPLRTLVLSANGFDPSRLRANWPKADVRLDIDGGIQPNGSVKGTLALDNRLAGPVDRGLLPVRSAGARLSGTLEAVRLDGVLLDFGSAGRFAGSGSAEGGSSRFVLHTDRFDLRGISNRMRATRIAGDIVLSAKDGTQTLDARLGQDRLRLDLNAVRQGDLLRLNEAVLRARGGEANASGEMQLTDARAFRLEGRLRRFDPSAFGTYPAADLNVDIAAEGKLAPEWQIAARYDVQPSRLHGQPLTGKGRFEADAKHLRGVDAALAFGPNTLSAKGDFGLPNDVLQWQIDAPRLDTIGDEYHGSVKGAGELGGTVNAPRLTMELAARGLAVAGYAVQDLQASANVSEGERDPLKIDIRIANAIVQGNRLHSASVQVDGTRIDHTIQLKANGDDIGVTAQAEGGWRVGRGWEGVIRSLRNEKLYRAALQSPAPLSFGPGRLSLRDFVLGLQDGGNVHVALLEMAGSRLETRGSARGVPLASLIALSPGIKEGIDTDLTLGADWSVAAADTLNGSVRVYREDGDITLRRTTELALGLSAMEARAVIERNAVRAELSIKGEHVGSIRASGNTRFAWQNGRWTLPNSSPLSIEAAASVPSLAWLGPMSGNPGIEVGGSLSLDAAGTGTVGSPRLSGTIAGDGLSLRWAEQGIHLHGGVLRAQLQGDRLQIERANFSGDEGTLVVEGGARMTGKELTVDMRLVADRLLLLSRPDRMLAVTGESMLSIDQSRLQLNGQFRANRARIEFPESRNITVSEDVVVLGRQSKQEISRPPPVRYDLALDLGSAFFIKGRGIDARLAGNVRVFSVPQDRLPRARGTIQVAEGSYEAYGQKLTIDRGLITFNGPVNNPGLDILAVRKVANVEGAVEAGVQVRGTALNPNARLVSTPSVSDTEKLSWLVLGKGTDQAGRQEFNVLSAAAGALLGTRQAESLQSRLANTFGIDEFGVSNAAGVEGAVVTLGKRISSRVYLAFEQGVTGATSLVKLRYILSRRLTVEVGTGTSSSVDVIYNWRFD